MGDDDEDEGEAQPTKYAFSQESKLDEDHLFYLQFTNNFISNVTRPRDFDHCTRWLEKLAGEPMYGVENKRNRNMYLAMLLVAMQDNKVKGPFSSFPPPGPLKSAADAFGLTTEAERAAEADMAFEQHDREINMTDYQFKSDDGRTYVATCGLKNSGGVMGYVGISVGGGEGLWLNKDGEKVSLTDVMCGDRIPAVDPKTPIKKQVEMITSYHWNQPPSEDEDASPFKFIPKLPENRSESNLVQVGTLHMTPISLKMLRELYPDELVCILEPLVSKSKANIDQMLRQHHNKVIDQVYQSYRDEVERGLNEYKLARQEWQQVMNVIQDMKRVEAEKSKKEADFAGSNNQMMQMLSDALNEAKKRKKVSYQEGLALDNTKTDMHKNIHERALIHKHELATLDKHVDKINGDIKRLRGDNRRKQQVIEALIHDLRDKKGIH